MTKRTPKPQDDLLPGEAGIAQAYLAGGLAMPPTELDARILGEARRAVHRRPASRRWAVPLSTAAVVVLSLGVVLLMTKQGALDHRTAPDVSGEYSVAPASPPASSPDVPATEPAPLAGEREEKLAKEVDSPRRVPAEPVAPAAQTVAPLAESIESRPARTASAEKMKKAEAPATTPPVTGRVAVEDRNSLARDESLRARSTAAAGAMAMKTAGADVTAVQATGSPGSYSFNVTVRSPDTGCKQYADWWEVLSEDGKLLYRRVLLHSHVGEQPFTRDGGPVPVQPGTVVWVRAHMNTSGYGGAALKGSVQSGFKPATLDAGFAAGVATQQPLPDGCAF